MLTLQAPSRAARLDDNQMRNSVYFDGFYYANLEFTSPHSTTVGTQSDFLMPPANFEIAPNDPSIVLHVIVAYPWGTHVMIVAGGKGYSTSLHHSTTGSPLESTLEVSEDGRRYKPRGACYRILIRVRRPDDIEGSTYCADLTTRMYSQKEFTDCEVVCDGVATPCHRAVLAAASPVLAKMLGSGMSEAEHRRIDVAGTDPNVVHAMLDFVYSGRVKCNTEHVVALLCLADYYQMPLLVRACAQAALDHIDNTNVVALTRAFRIFADAPETKYMWTQLVEKLSTTPELLSAMMMDF